MKSATVHRWTTKYTLLAIITGLMMALFVDPAGAQVLAMTNLDVKHLVAIRVSDDTIIAAIREAQSTHF